MCPDCDWSAQNRKHVFSHENSVFLPKIADQTKNFICKCQTGIVWQFAKLLCEKNDLSLQKVLRNKSRELIVYGAVVPHFYPGGDFTAANYAMLTIFCQKFAKYHPFIFKQKYFGGRHFVTCNLDFGRKIRGFYSGPTNNNQTKTIRNKWWK